MMTAAEAYQKTQQAIIRTVNDCIRQRAALTWNFIDKTTWPKAGFWQHEPDKMVWTDRETGLVCMVHRAHISSLCGYVGVPPGHPWHGQHGVDANVHGSLTFAAPCGKLHPDGSGVCHTPRPGEPDDIWWLGFDCAHGFDLIPAQAKYCEGLGHPDERYRDLLYVVREVESLARQAKEAAHVH